MFKLLVVEDNAAFRQTLRNLLSSRFPFIALEEAEDGKEALQKIEGFLPDLIFMDIKLPGENGLELTKKIKRSYPETIVIILTGYDLPEYRKAASRNGASYFLSKGLSTADEISTLVESILSDLKTPGEGRKEGNKQNNPKTFPAADRFSQHRNPFFLKGH